MCFQSGKGITEEGKKCETLNWPNLETGIWTTMLEITFLMLLCQDLK